MNAVLAAGVLLDMVPVLATKSAASCGRKGKSLRGLAFRISSIPDDQQENYQGAALQNDAYGDRTKATERYFRLLSTNKAKYRVTYLVGHYTNRN